MGSLGFFAMRDSLTLLTPAGTPHPRSLQWGDGSLGFPSASDAVFVAQKKTPLRGHGRHGGDSHDPRCPRRSVLGVVCVRQ